MIYWTAISIGLLGSLHCIGMCGPIALALPLDRSNNWKVLGGSLLYNFGRLSSYILIGALFGFLGYGFALAGFQRWVSIAVGLIMILSVLPTQIKALNNFSLGVYSLWLNQLKSALAKKLGNKSPAALLSIGFLNGLLPCGLVYMGLAGSAAMPSFLEGAFFMFCFGLGTLPLMLAIAVYGNKIQFRFLKFSRKAIPVFIILIGALFILRGMNLGIPYLSPKIQAAGIEVVECH